MRTIKKPWYSQFGPFAWYKNEWVKLDLTLGSLLVLMVDYRFRSGYMSIHVGGRINGRSMYGRPSSYSPRWSLFRENGSWSTSLAS